MKRTRRHWVLLAGSAAAIGCGVALGQGALTEALDATLPDAREIASFNRPGTITLLSSDGQVIQKLGPATRGKGQSRGDAAAGEGGLRGRGRSAFLSA